ncbi:hypothetical protein PYW07_011706 [Mythimna separata]|uniref:RRM domain-containing protein n=1 Tax=Mythimna separata TaxID=271217 RepID=A0AAD7Y6T2_MYTSE|nr:hypothetical protein PYW07_011706 [Mythimna separata]
MNTSTSKPPSPIKQKRKRKSELRLSTSEHKNMKLNKPETVPTTVTTVKPPKSAGVKRKAEKPEGTVENLDYGEKYPILKDQELVCKFLKVQMTNNQKGRIRQAVKESLQGTSSILEPEVIHSKIQSILRNSTNLTDAELRRIRILYNLLKTSLKEQKLSTEGRKPKKPEKTKKKNDGDSPKVKDAAKKVKTEKSEKPDQKPRGPKRYIVFLGNLPLDISKDKIINHFSEMNEQIIDIRIPKSEGKKSAIAYLELSNEPSYEFALSKHHSMLGSKRINVLYTAPKKGKVTKDKAKAKSAKLIALQKSGKLVGSVPLAKKRSQRRLKMKKAQAKAAAIA